MAERCFGSPKLRRVCDTLEYLSQHVRAFIPPRQWPPNSPLSPDLNLVDYTTYACCRDESTLPRSAVPIASTRESYQRAVRQWSVRLRACVSEKMEEASWFYSKHLYVYISKLCKKDCWNLRHIRYLYCSYCGEKIADYVTLCTGLYFGVTSTGTECRYETLALSILTNG